MTPGASKAMKAQQLVIMKYMVQHLVCRSVVHISKFFLLENATIYSFVIQAALEMLDFPPVVSGEPLRWNLPVLAEEP